MAPPNPGFDFTCQQQESLRVLSARTRLSYNPKFHSSCVLYILVLHPLTAWITLLPYLAYVLPNAVTLNENGDDTEEYDVEVVAVPGGVDAADAAVVGAGVPPAVVGVGALPPAAPSAGATAAVVGGPPAAVLQGGGPAGIPVNCGIRGVGAVGRQQTGIAAIGGVVSQAGLCGCNPNQTLLMAQMNHDLNQGMVQMHAFIPIETKRKQTFIKSAIMSVYASLAASRAQGRNTAMFVQQINCLKIQLDAILNAL